MVANPQLKRASRGLAPALFAPVAAFLLGGCLGASGSVPAGYQAALPPPPPPVAPAQPTGSIFAAASYAPLAADNRARRVGDVLTIALVERTVADKQAGTSTKRDSGIDFELPTAAGSIASDYLNAGASFSTSGRGSATQSNNLRGEISVTVAELLPNGALLVRGQKLVRLNRGDEHIQISGLVRPEDIGADNRVPSTRVADARITYAGTGEIANASRQGWLTRLMSFFSPL